MTQFKPAALLPILLVLSACATAPADETALIADPYEGTNRGIHGFNKGVDTALLRPASRAWGAVMPEPAERVVENFMGNLALPGDMVNNVLQGDGDALGNNLGRFLMNTTIGIGGLLDVAGDAGITRQEADFGQTLALYGVEEGPYVELPLLGPSTARDAVGTVVDMITNPLGLSESETAEDILAGVAIVGPIDTRDQFAGVIDGVLYESEDSYEAAKIAYIQARRAFVNGTEAGDDGFVDIYAE